MDELLAKLKQQVALAHEFGFPYAVVPVNLITAKKLVDLLEEQAEINPLWWLDRMEKAS